MGNDYEKMMAFHIMSLKSEIDACHSLASKHLLKMIGGIVLAIIGAVASFNSYMNAVTGYNGGRYTIWCGLILVGLIFAANSLSNFEKVKRKEKELTNELYRLTNKY